MINDSSYLMSLKLLNAVDIWVYFASVTNINNIMILKMEKK